MIHDGKKGNMLQVSENSRHVVFQNRDACRDTDLRQSPWHIFISTFS